MLSAYHTLAEGLVEGSHVEVQPLVNLGPVLGALGVEFVLLVPSVLVDEVGGGGAALVRHEVTIDQGGDVVLRVQLDKDR